VGAVAVAERYVYFDEAKAVIWIPRLTLTLT